MIGELEQALSCADYRKALEIKNRLQEIYGAGAVPPGLGYLERLGADFWERPGRAGRETLGLQDNRPRARWWRPAFPEGAQRFL